MKLVPFHCTPVDKGLANLMNLRLFSTNSRDRVIGELWKLTQPELVLQALDEYEGCAPSSPLPHEYERTIQPIEFNGQVTEAWMYIYRLSTVKLIKIDSGLFINPT